MPRGHGGQLGDRVYQRYIHIPHLPCTMRAVYPTHTCGGDAGAGATATAAADAKWGWAR